MTRLTYAWLIAVLLSSATLNAQQPPASDPPTTYAGLIAANYRPLDALRRGEAAMPSKLGRKISLSRNGVLLQQALLEIATQAGLGLSYGEDLARSKTVVSLDVTRASAADALAAAVQGTNWTVFVNAAGQVTVVKAVKQQPGTVTGVVTDSETGEGISGVDVSLEATQWRAMTDADGRYRIPDVPPGTHTLVAHRLGYAEARQSVTVTDGAEATVDVELQIEATQIGEVIVTAQKREERAHDIPVSIAVVSTQDIERRGLIGMEDYLRSIPGVNQIDKGPSSNAIVIRGITTSPEFENLSSGTTVASYFDETPITGAAGMGAGGIDVRPVDIERIEVLRGPQGTAYGSASLGGTMRMIPVKPKLDGFSAKLAGSYAGTSGFGSENSMMQGVINVPVVKDKFALRAVGYRYDESGFYRNIAGIDSVTIAAADSFGLGDFVRGHVQDDVGRIISTGGRLAALWQATDKLNLSMNFLTQRIEQDGSPVADVGKYEQRRVPIAPQGRVRDEVGETNDTEMDLLNLVLNYDLGWAALTSAASWVDGGSVWAFNNSPAPSSTTGPSDFKSVTAETRLASQLEGRFQFLGGLFYEDVDDDFLQTLDWPGAPETNPFGTNPMLVFFEQTRDLDQRAIFGEVSYDLTETLSATVGGRYYKFEKNERSLLEGSLVDVPLGTGVRSDLDSNEDGFTLKANLSYNPTNQSLLYASWAEGFRLGRPVVGLPSATCDTDSDGLVDGTSITIESTRKINSDFLDNYEVGGKFTLFNRRMVVDAAVYHIEWDGLPIRAFSPESCGISYVANVGAATSDGMEFQASLFVADGLRLDFGAGYTNAELSKDAPALAAENGARLPGSPEVSANLAAQYDFDVAGRQTFVHVGSIYTGEFFGDLQQAPDLGAGDYVKVDARAGVIVKNLNIELFVRNLTNEDGFTWRGMVAGNSFFGYRLRPRTVGMQLGYIFQ